MLSVCIKLYKITTNTLIPNMSFNRIKRKIIWFSKMIKIKQFTHTLPTNQYTIPKILFKYLNDYNWVTNLNNAKMFVIKPNDLYTQGNNLIALILTIYFLMLFLGKMKFICVIKRRYLENVIYFEFIKWWKTLVWNNDRKRTQIKNISSILLI